MSASAEQRRELEALRERISTLSAAILRISTSLDVDTVLARNCGQLPRPDRCPVWGDHDHRRSGAAAGRAGGVPDPGAAAALTEPPPPAQQPAEAPRIPVVDDDPRALRFVRDALAGAGDTPLLTGAPHDLRRIIRAERPRLVLLDLMLPDIAGIELMRQVPGVADLPVIFISAYRRDETVAKALESGAVDYIVKPFSPTELVARIRAALRRREAPEPGLFAGGGEVLRLARAPRVLWLQDARTFWPCSRSSPCGPTYR